MEDLQDKIIELMDLFDGEVTTADKIDRPERALEKEAIDDFMKRNPMAGGGMLVQPSADGSRPGYKDDNLPDFITKTPYDTYRVRSKKTKSNPKINASFKTLKEAKAFVKEKNLVKSKTGVEYPELVAKAQSVVDDYNKIVESAVKKNDLRNVKFFEGYVKDRFKKTSDQNQILRQVYKKKLNYTDLTQVRKSVAKNLITEVMDMETIVPNNYIYNLLGGKNGLKSDTIKIVSNGLKNQTKIKVDNAIEAIVEADEIIDDSFIKTVANRIGRTQFRSRKGEAAWRKALENNSYYKKNKKLLDYAFTPGAKRNRAVGMSLKEILDDAKYKIGGGVTFSGKQTQFSGLRRYIFDYAKSHWHRNNFDGNPGKSLIEFYDKNGKPIKWKPGLKLKLGEVQFKIPSESDVMWSYNGAPKGSVSVTGPIADSSGVFKEVTETYNVMKEISDAPVTDPITGKETTYNKLVSDIYKKGYGYQGKNIFGLDIDHFKGVRDHPFKNLRAMDRRLNISLGAIDKTFDNRNLKAKLKNEILGELATTKGSAYNTALKTYFVNQATNVLDKGIAPTLATESPYYSAVKNVYEQKNLPKVQKELLEKSYQRAIKLEQTLASFASNPQCTIFIKKPKAAADGGRIGYQTGTVSLSECAKDGAKNFQEGKFKTADQVQDAAKLLSGGRRVLSGLMKYGIIPELAFVGLEATGRSILGEKPLNAIKKSIDTFTFGLTDFTSGIEAEKFGKFGDLKLDVDKYRNSLAKVNSIQQDIANLETLNTGSQFGYEGDQTEAIQMKKAQLEAAKKELQQNMISPDKVSFIDRMSDNIADAQMAKSSFAKASLKDQMDGIPGVADYMDTETARVFPKQPSQAELNLNMLPNFREALKTDQAKIDRTIMNAPDDVLKDISPEALELKKGLQEAYKMENLKDTFGAEQIYGTQGSFFGEPLAKGGRAGFKSGALRKGVLSLIDEGIKKTPKDTTSALDKLIKKTLDEDLFDKKDRIIDQINISEAKKRKNYPYNQQVFEEPKNLDFYDAITKSNFRTKTGPYYDRIRKNKAGGGLLKQAGDRSGAPPESGPNSQGLQGLLNRVKKT